MAGKSHPERRIDTGRLAAAVEEFAGAQRTAAATLAELNLKFVRYEEGNKATVEMVKKHETILAGDNNGNPGLVRKFDALHQWTHGRMNMIFGIFGAAGTVSMTVLGAWILKISEVVNKILAGQQ